MGFARINELEYQRLVANTTLLATHRDRPSILLNDQQEIIKHIYRRGLWSSSTFWPYARRFQRSAKRLKKLGFSVPSISGIYHYPTRNCDILIYSRMPGASVHDLASSGKNSALEKVPAYIARLHRLGVYFRDLHLGNIIYDEANETFSIVDLASVKIYAKPLTQQQREKNLTHLKNRAEDQPLLEQYGWENFLASYQDVNSE